MVRKGLTVVPGGHLSVILVINIGFWQGKVKILPGMGLAYLHICKVFGFGALSWPLNRSKKTQINWGNHLGSIYGVLDPFRGLYRAPKPTVLHWVYSASRILGHILTFSDPPQPTQSNHFGSK